MLTWFHGPWIRLKLPRNQLRMPGFQATSGLGLCSPLAMLDGSRFSCHATIIDHDMWPALPQQSIWRCWWQHCGRLLRLLLSCRPRLPSHLWQSVRPSRLFLTKWTLVRVLVRGLVRVPPLHPHLRHHPARRDRRLDPVLGLTLDLARRRVRAGLHRPLHNSQSQSEDESPPLRDEETLDLGIPSLGDCSALDHELLTTEDELDQTPLSLHRGRLRRPLHRCTPGWALPQTPWLILPESLCVLGGSHGSPRTSSSLARWNLCLLFRHWPRF